jgi:DNA-binding response OmpR family regulator
MRAALDRLGLPAVLVDDAASALRALCRPGAAFAGMVVGDRAGPVSGLSLCGLARDAGSTLPILLLTADDGSSVAARAARLRVIVLWHPVSTRRLETALRDLLIPREQSLAS